MASPFIPDPLRGRSAPEQWIALPRELLARLSVFRSLAELKVVLYVLWHTYGYREYASMKAITLDEFEHGRKRKDGTRMDEGTGLSRAAIKLGLKQAKEDAFLYETVDEHDQARIVRWYAIQLPSDGSVRGLESSPLTQPYAAEVLPNGSASGIDSSPLTQPYDAQGLTNSSASGIDSSPLAQPYSADMLPNGSASGVDSSPQRDRFQPPEGQILAPGGLESIPRSEKETLERNPKKQSIEKEAGSDRLADADEMESLAQRFADQQILQSLLAERQSLQTLQPGQSGWGAAQRRLRAIAPEIARIQALSALQATGLGSADSPAISGEADPPEARHSATADRPVPLIRDQAASEEASQEQGTRRQRLMQLQGELAHLKRTPSMQLLARQRIPRLETAIKQLIAELQERA